MNCWKEKLVKAACRGVCLLSGQKLVTEGLVDWSLSHMRGWTLHDWVMALLKKNIIEVSEI